MEIDKSTAYEFLDKLVEDFLPVDALNLLKDVIVNDLLFPGGDGVHVSNEPWEAEVSEFMKTGQKLKAIMVVKKQFEWPLEVAKVFVESRNWSAENAKAVELQKEFVAKAMARLSSKYHMKGE